MTILASYLFAATTPALIPIPQSLEWRPGDFQLRAATVVTNQGAGVNIVERLRDYMRVPLRAGRSASSSIVLTKAAGLPPEGYRLTIGTNSVQLSASSDAGFFNGIQTLRQLNQNGALKACKIEDSPSFGWRGMMLDESRHFFGVTYVRQFIDNLAAHKFNRFHWHLTDDGGWRIQSERYPELTRIGAWRKEQGVEWDYGNLWFPGPGSGQKLYGGSYTKDQVRDMIRYAAQRNIEIVPEIEMPGHSTAAMSAYPQFQCSPPAQVKADYLKAVRSQAPSMMCPGKDATIEFCKNILNETLQLFPSKFIHIGADEVDKTLWRRCADCQKRMRDNNLKDEHELQSWFVRQMDAHLASKGRRLIGWDEILEGGLAPGATVMSWRGIAGGIAAAKAGHDVVLSPTTHCYFDYSYETTPLSKVYSYEVIPSELVGAQRNKVLGGQANVWTEWLSTPAEVDSMAWPRAAALSEVLWSRASRRNWKDFEDRLNRHYTFLERLGVKYRLTAPTLEPSVLNTAVAREWRISRPQLPGSKVVLENGTVVTGDVVRPTSGDVRLFLQTQDGRRGDPTIGRVVNLKTTTTLTRRGLIRLESPHQGKTVPGAGIFRDKLGVVLSRPLLSDAPAPRAALFEGGMVVEKPGRYTLGVGADDGAVLYLDGQKIIDNDGEHGYIEKTVTIDLQAGVYPMQLFFFDSGGARRLELFWTPPGGSRQHIDNFRH